VEVANHPSLNFGFGEDFSIQAWVKYAGSDGSQTIYRSSTSTAKFILERRSGGLVQFQVVEAKVLGTTNINDGGWHHILAVRDGGVLSVYVDGVSEGNPATKMDSVTDTANYRIGGRQDDLEFFDGLIDEVKIFNYALTAEQIKIEYNSGAVKFGQ
jgi:hypothetical protein